MAAAVDQPPLVESAEPRYSIEAASAAMRATLAGGGLPRLERRGMAPADSQVAEVYRDGLIPVWVTGEGRPSPTAHEALAALRDAAREALRPDDYRSAQLDSVATVLAQATEPDPAAIGRFDVTLTTAVLRFAADLHVGRVDPRTVDTEIKAPDDLHNIPSLVAAAVADQRVAESLESLRPPLVQYRRLRDALATYRALADSAVADVPAAEKPVKPGDRWAGQNAVHRRLILTGDVDRSVSFPTDSTVYGGALAEGVTRFQDRHGLEADGVIGKATVAALNVPFGERARQIELGLERLRWLPDLTGSRFIVVNIPTFQLWAWDSLTSDGTPTLSMNVVVGQSMKTMTPVMQEEMAYLVFRPYWNVPRSIAVGEILPKVRKDPGYLTLNNMELVAAGGDDAVPLAATPANVDRLARGQLRVRQRPGPKNSLGLVKFIFPNDQAIYLHDSPAEELFSRARRDFSHGCVRVERPAELAEWVLREREGWTRERIVSAMQQGKTQTVTLPRHIPVFLFYTTAISGPDGTLRFAEDFYQRDARLRQALEAQ
ncbi:MAG TPA: L,D-transpeptidase family protein [Gemmatimonadales bacterium]